MNSIDDRRDSELNRELSWTSEAIEREHDLAYHDDEGHKLVRGMMLYGALVVIPLWIGIGFLAWKFCSIVF